jgi:hypothetical protein
MQVLPNPDCRRLGLILAIPCRVPAKNAGAEPVLPRARGALGLE